ncbi:MAG: beta-ketoacyl-[acyl-carrier-protein] synthase family protein [Bacteroidales bacterium]|nr:beta-ketoacyl-[acyl-carrier-protein] synthase family protein [Bacteroidales bacterium]
MKRVVITGMGIYSCIGTSLDTVQQSLFNGVSGVVLDTSRHEMGFRSALTGKVPMPDLKSVLDRHQRSLMPEEAMYAYCATADAIKNAGVDEDFFLHEDVGLIYGNDSTAEAVVTGVDRIRQYKDTTLCGAGTIFKSMNSTVSMNLACLFHLRGINLTISAACASSSHSIGLGTMMIRNGLQNMVIVGGTQETNPYAVASFDGISAFSVREDVPSAASRPFDKDRDGLVPSGGAATLILEEYEHAVKRGAPIIAEVLGWGFSSNGEHISTPNVEGPVKSLEMSIKDAGINIHDIGYINAHATSTPVGDKKEAQAIYKVFGDANIPVTSTKSQTGHEMWMAGASEVIYSILMMQGGFVAANLNFDYPDEDSEKLHIAAERLNHYFNTFLSNSFGFGGTNSTLIIRAI